MDSNTIIVLAALIYGAFLGYCFGRYVGYNKGADMVREFYRK
jgi:hypothetical protein